MPTPPISSACSQSEPLSNTSTTCSKMMVELMKHKRQKNINILLEKPISDEIFDYLHDSQVECSLLHALQWWCKIGFEKYSRLAMLAKEFLLVCVSSSPSERLFSTGQGIVTYKKGELSPRTISILMTLKSWGKKDEVDADEEKCFLLLCFKLEIIIGKVSDYELFLLIDVDIFISFHVHLFMVKRDRS